jgi:flagellin-like protein
MLLISKKLDIKLGEMDGMKANRKFIEGEEAVSAVIGVILMVAITVAIAATVYVYVSGMIGTSPQATPNIQFVKDDIADKLTVASADPNDLLWADISIIGTYTSLVNSTANVLAGDYLDGCSGTISIRHVDTNTLLGTWTFV